MCAKPNCTDHILYRSLNRELFASLHVCVLNWELTRRRQIIAVGKWECYEAHTPSCDPGLLQELHWHVLQKKFIVMKCNLYVFICVFVCVFRVRSGAWWWDWWWVCAGWCWSSPSRRPDVALWTRPLRCCAASTTSISPFCSVASLLSWLLQYHCSHHRPPTNRCVHIHTVNRTIREVSLWKCFAVDTPVMLSDENKRREMEKKQRYLKVCLHLTRQPKKPCLSKSKEQRIKIEDRRCF